MSSPEDCPPSYPLPYTYRQAVAWTVAALSDKPRLPRDALTTGETVPGSDLSVRRLVERCVADRTHREQLKAWCRAEANPGDRDQSFRRACDAHPWSRTTALKNVERALAMVFWMMNRPGGESG